MQLAAVTSPAELLTVAAVLRADPARLAGPVTVLIFGNELSVPDGLAEEFLAHADAFGAWSGVGAVRIANVKDGDEVAERFLEAAGGLPVSRLILSALHKPIERRLPDLWPDAAIELFDNGLSSHVGQEVKASKSGRPGGGWLRRDHLERVERAWFTLSKDLPHPAHIPEEIARALPGEALRESARSAAAKLAVAAGAPPLDRGGSRDLILGTAFFRTGLVTLEAEREAHLAMLEEIAAEGRPPPLFKPHPRQGNHPVLTGADGVDVIDSVLPVELWAEQTRISRAFSCASTALLVLRRHFGVPALRFGASLMEPVARKRAHIGLLARKTPLWRPRGKRPPRVIGVGLPKTGTKTLDAALKTLGVKPSRRFDREALEEYLDTGATHRAEAWMMDREACMDWPWPLLFEALDKAHPGSKFILTRRRDAAAWTGSQKRQALKKTDSRLRERLFGFSDPRGRESELDAYHQAHLDRVRAYFRDRPGDLLEVCWEEGDGWPELCGFLDRPLPEADFPHANASAEALKRATAPHAEPQGGPPYALSQGFDRAERTDQPFPYAVIRNCLPEAEYQRLSESFPADMIPDSILAADNKRHDICASWGKSRNDPSLAPAPWRIFMAENSRQAIAQGVRSLFLDPFERRRGRLWSPDPSREFVQGEIEVRVSIGVNTPARSSRAVRGAHCDNRAKAFVGLFYLRSEGDEAEGGDLELYRWRDGCERPGEWPSAIDADRVERVQTVRYEANTLVLFPNFDDALHGVSVRAAGAPLRRFAVISGWFANHSEDEETRRRLQL